MRLKAENRLRTNGEPTHFRRVDEGVLPSGEDHIEGFCGDVGYCGCQAGTGALIDVKAGEADLDNGRV